MQIRAIHGQDPMTGNKERHKLWRMAPLPLFYASVYNAGCVTRRRAALYIIWDVSIVRHNRSPYAWCIRVEEMGIICPTVQQIPY